MWTESITFDQHFFNAYGEAKCGSFFGREDLFIDYTVIDILQNDREVKNYADSSFNLTSPDH